MGNAYQVVKDFEQALSSYTGAPYVVTVESCSAAIFLCCIYESVKSKPPIEIPSITYPSVPASIINAGGKVKFRPEMNNWQRRGWYPIGDNIIDSAKYIARGMYANAWSYPLVCLSFHAKKTIGIGRGGAILTNDERAYEWFKLARFDGRHEKPLHEDTPVICGWNMYMTPEQAARGLELMQWIPDEVLLPPDPYTDLSKADCYGV